MVYVSTNMVFDGTKGSPYTEFDTPCPRGVYATSKRAGERYVEHLASRFYIARTSWVYGLEGDSFARKIIRAAESRGKLSVVADETATPTYAEDLADALLKLAGTGLYGWYNMVNEGECSRFEYAREVMQLTGRGSIEITPTALADYVRPAYTPLTPPSRTSSGRKQASRFARGRMPSASTSRTLSNAQLRKCNCAACGFCYHPDPQRGGYAVRMPGSAPYADLA